jgi:RNA polymerase sigma-70 factor (ECF subfamily)
MDRLTFTELIARVRSGDDTAAAELVRHYEPVLRRIIRVRLTSARLRRRCDTEDVCQSVLASFFVRAALGQYDVATPDDLVKLLGRMARNKVVDRARGLAREHSQGVAAELSEETIPDPGPSPSRRLMLQDLLERARQLLPEADRRLLEARLAGREWVELAAEGGVSAEALRKRLSRSVDLVARQLGLEEVGDA